MVTSLLDLIPSPCLSHTTTTLKMHKEGSVLYILPLPNNRVMKLCAIYSILCISFHNVFVEKEKYNE